MKIREISNKIGKLNIFQMTVRMIDVAVRNLEVETRKRSDTGSDMDPLLIGIVNWRGSRYSCRIINRI